ncbi:MAG TPA: FxsA family protein [Rhizobiales bacterium]|nr:FxsA family protein [Hyphomicrobiales bacterium]
MKESANMYFFLALAVFIGVPAAEIALLIKIGGQIGLFPTISLIFLTAILGIFMLRHQGLKTLLQAQQAMAQNQLPVDSAIHGIFLMIAGAFLLTPGFITDSIGFLLLIPPLRLVIARYIWTLINRSGHVQTSVFGAGLQGNDANQGYENPDETIIEGEFTVEDLAPGPPNPDSPWRDKNKP